MSTFQSLLKRKGNRIKHGKNPLPIEILRSFQAERKEANNRIRSLVENRIIEIIERGDKQ